MKTLKVIAGICATIIVVFVGYTIILNRSEPQATQSTTANTSPKETVQEPTTSPKKVGTYTAYDETVVAKDTTTRLLFFHAPWCPQCRELDESILQSTLPENVTVYKTDYDSNQALRKKYGVTLQTTVVRLDANGNVAKKFIAYQTPSWSNVAKELL